MLDGMSYVEQSQTLPSHSQEVQISPPAQAATVALAYLNNTQLASKNTAFRVLAELATQTVMRAQEGKSTDFSAQNLKAGVAPDAVKDPSGWLSPHWTRLTEEESKWEEGMAAAARREGLRFLPKLEKVLGSPSVYRIRAVALPEESLAESVPPVPEGGVYYTPESIMAPGAFLNKALRSGIIPWNATARWTVLAGVMAALFVALAAVGLVLVFGIRITRPLSPADVLTFAVLAAMLVTVAALFRFFGELFDLRIVMAPSLLTPMSKDNVTLELRPSDAERQGQLVFARYSSTCPTCGGNVELFDGGRDFPGRIVGRCRRSAREHVFSFDHALKVGRPLLVS